MNRPKWVSDIAETFDPHRAAWEIMPADPDTGWAIDRSRNVVFHRRTLSDGSLAVDAARISPKSYPNAWDIAGNTIPRVGRWYPVIRG